jgi:hypothetical protein
MSKRKAEDGGEDSNDPKKSKIEAQPEDKKEDKTEAKEDKAVDKADEKKEVKTETTAADKKEEKKPRKKRVAKKKRVKKNLRVNEMTVPQLKEYLRDRQLSTKGVKDTLVDRLDAAIKKEKTEAKKAAKRLEKEGSTTKKVDAPEYQALGDLLKKRPPSLGALSQQVDDGQDLRLEAVLLFKGATELKAGLGELTFISALRGMRTDKVRKSGVRSLKARGYHRTPEWWGTFLNFLHAEGYMNGLRVTEKSEKVLEVVDFPSVLTDLAAKYY